MCELDSLTYKICSYFRESMLERLSGSLFTATSYSAVMTYNGGEYFFATLDGIPKSIRVP